MGYRPRRTRKSISYRYRQISCRFAWWIAPAGLAVAFPPLPRTAPGTYPNLPPNKHATHQCDHLKQFMSSRPLRRASTRGGPRLHQFGRKKEAAIAALLTARNTEEAAKTVGVSPKTLLRWQKLPEFERAYREARMAAFRQATARLQQASSPAVTTLLKIMVHPAAPWGNGRDRHRPGAGDLAGNSIRSDAASKGG